MLGVVRIISGYFGILTEEHAKWYHLVPYNSGYIWYHIIVDILDDIIPLETTILDYFGRKNHPSVDINRGENRASPAGSVIRRWSCQHHKPRHPSCQRCQARCGKPSATLTEHSVICLC